MDNRIVIEVILFKPEPKEEVERAVSIPLMLETVLSLLEEARIVGKDCRISRSIGPNAQINIFLKP